jgi:2Fe-2S ferredoxin
MFGEVSAELDTALIAVTFVQPDGRKETFAAQPGETVLDVALDNAVAGILGQCGGGATCCTCHCWIDKPWSEKFALPSRNEQEMLEYAWGHNEASRLVCQLDLQPAHDGLQVRVPQQQS